MRGSIVVRTFSMAMVLIAVLAVVSVIDLLAARNVGLRVQRITGSYLAMDGGVARADAYSTEEAYRTRQYIAAKTLGLHDPGSNPDATIADLKDLEGKIDESLADARDATVTEMYNSDPLIDQDALKRIAGRIARIQTNEHSDLVRQVDLIQAYDRGDKATFRQSFGDLAKWRAGYDEYLDATRWMVFHAAQDAGDHVARYQKKSAFFSVGLLALAGALTIVMAWFLSQKMVRPDT